MVLDNKDREILFELSLNGRINLTQLAKTLGLSKQVISYRLKQMEEKGVIKQYYAISNIYGLGKTHYRVFLKYQNISSPIEAELREYLLQQPRISWVLSLAGDFDLFFVVWADHIVQFEEVYDDVMGRFGRYVQEKYFSIATRIEYLPYFFLLEGDERNRDAAGFVFGDGFDCYQPNELEKKILKALNHNARISIAQLADELGIMPRGVKTKIAQLIEKRVIMGFNVKIDHNLLGYTYQKVLLKLNDTSRPELMRLSAYLKLKKSVIYLLKTIGTYDFEFELMTRSPDEFYTLIKDLRLQFADNIKDHSMVIMSEEPKFEHLEL